MSADQGEENRAAGPYAVSAEFYDILQAESDRRVAERRFAGAAAVARIGVVDVGAGTGLVSEVLLACSAAPVHAVEPSAVMRVALMSRLAALGADQRARVSVHPCSLQESGLEETADLVVCSNVAGLVEPRQRPGLWKAVARALVPGGVLLLEPPPGELPDEPEVRELPPVRVGPDIFSARMDSRAEDGLLLVTFDYRVERDGQTVRRERERFTLWPAPPEVVRGELREAGLRVEGGLRKGVLRVVRERG